MLWCCSSGPTWDLRHKGPFPPWLQPAWSIKTDTSYNSPTQQLVRAPQWDDPSHSTKWATVHQQLAYSPVLPLVGATESPFSLPIVYKKTLNPDWDEMVFGDSSLPSSWSASLPIIHHSLLQQLVSWFIDLSRGEQNELGLSNKIWWASQEPCCSWWAGPTWGIFRKGPSSCQDICPEDLPFRISWSGMGCPTVWQLEQGIDIWELMGSIS